MCTCGKSCVENYKLSLSSVNIFPNIFRPFHFAGVHMLLSLSERPQPQYVSFGLASMSMFFCVSFNAEARDGFCVNLAQMPLRIYSSHTFFQSSSLKCFTFLPRAFVIAGSSVFIISFAMLSSPKCLAF